MNVIIANKFQAVTANLDIEVIKALHGEFEVDELISMFNNFFFNKMIIDITAIKNYQDLKNIQKLSLSFETDKLILLLNEDPNINNPSFLSKIISMGIYNFTNNLEGLKWLYEHPNGYKDVVQYQHLDESSMIAGQSNLDSRIGGKIIGFKNLTEHAGATSLIYMIKKALSEKYSVAAVEINKTDFLYFQDKDMTSTTKQNFANEILKKQDFNVLLVDLNDFEQTDVCSVVIYLIEPSIIKLNKMVKKNRKIFEELSDKKVVLNQSMLSENDVKDFEMESDVKVLYNIPPLDDRNINSEKLNEFLGVLGFGQVNGNDDKKGKIFGIF